MRHPRRAGIGRVEVIVVAVVLAVLGCLLVAWLPRQRESARRQHCANNLKQLALGLRSYAEVHGAFPRGTVANDSLPPTRRLSWYVGTWAFVGDGQLQLLIDLENAWDDEGNLQPKVRFRTGSEDKQWAESPLGPMALYRCPSDGTPLPVDEPSPTSYVGIAGVGEDAAALPEGDPKQGIFGYDRQTRLSEITDGIETTALLAETAFQTGPWTAGGPPTVRGVAPEQAPCFGPGRPFGGNHPQGGNVAIADGRVRFVHEAIDPYVWAALATVAGAPEEPAKPAEP